jgi:hypothetical protein
MCENQSFPWKMLEDVGRCCGRCAPLSYISLEDVDLL